MGNNAERELDAAVKILMNEGELAQFENDNNKERQMVCPMLTCFGKARSNFGFLKILI